jgi:DNA-binding NtrC family response regulator
MKKNIFVIGESEFIKRLDESVSTFVRKIKDDDQTNSRPPSALIVGDCGVGKEFLARQIHANIFVDNERFHSLHCTEATSIADIESLHVPSKHNGTICYLNFEQLGIQVQNVLFTKYVQAVVNRPQCLHVFTSHLSLQKLRENAGVDRSLLTMLEATVIAIDPLKKRRDDILPLARHFLKQALVKYTKSFTGFTPHAERALLNYDWPGNLDELKLVVERAVLLEVGPLLELPLLERQVRSNISLASSNSAPVLAFDSNRTNTVSTSFVTFNSKQHLNVVYEKGLSQLREETDTELTKEILVAALIAESGNVSSIARKLKLDRANLLRLLRRFEIKPAMYRSAAVTDYKKAG